MAGISERYVSGSYLEHNPDWHVAGSPWKAKQVRRALGDWAPSTVCEVGCGAGEILRQLQEQLPDATLVGYDIAPKAIELAAARAGERLSFRLRDAAEDDQRFDLMLIMDVIEHVPDPIAFLGRLRFKSEQTILHIPLDICAMSALRARDLQLKRSELGHIHYFTPETALATVAEAGFEVLKSEYTRSWEIWPLSRRGRWARYVLPPAAAVRLVGGYSLLVTAANRR